jgi:hypothetical protein
VVEKQHLVSQAWKAQQDEGWWQEGAPVGCLVEEK